MGQSSNKFGVLLKVVVKNVKPEKTKPPVGRPTGG